MQGNPGVDLTGVSHNVSQARLICLTARVLLQVTFLGAFSSASEMLRRRASPRRRHSGGNGANNRDGTSAGHVRSRTRRLTIAVSVFNVVVGILALCVFVFVVLTTSLPVVLLRGQLLGERSGVGSNVYGT